MNLLDGDDEVRNVESSNTNAPINTHRQPPPYHTQQNYPYLPPYYHPHYFPLPPPTNTSSASNSTPSSTPTETLKSPWTNNDTTNDEVEADEVEGASVGAKKWSLEEDKRLITAWINTSVDPITGADQKRTSFWGKVAANFNTHAPKGAMQRSGKTCNARWNRTYPLVNKWVGIMDQMERNNVSGSNIEDIMNRAHETFLKRVGRKFDLEHWYYMLKDQPKWRIFCDTLDEGQSKRLKVNEMGGYSSPSTPVEEDLEVENDGTVRPIGRKAAKRKLQQKATNALVDLVINHLSTLGATANEKVKIFRNLVTVVGKKATAAQEAVRIRDEAEKRKEKRAEVEMRKQALKERQYDDQIILMDLSTLSEEDAAYFTMMKEEIRQKRMGKAPQN